MKPASPTPARSSTSGAQATDDEVSANASARTQSGNRLTQALSGKAANHALADPEFCEQLLNATRASRPWTISQIAVRALDHLGIEVRSAASETFTATEAELIASYPWDQLWNVRR
jgi:hypothetical protein